MFFLYLVQGLYRGLLQHLLQDGGRLTTADEHAMVLGYRSIEPQTIADDVGLWNRLEGLCSPDQHVTANYHRMDVIRRHRHHFLIKRQLQTQQVL